MAIFISYRDIGIVLTTTASAATAIGIYLWRERSRRRRARKSPEHAQPMYQADLPQHATFSTGAHLPLPPPPEEIFLSQKYGQEIFHAASIEPVETEPLED